MMTPILTGHHHLITAVPDNSRYNRLQQRNARRASNAIESEDESMETGVACQTEKAELCDADLRLRQR